jgi:hypothetical protein
MNLQRIVRIGLLIAAVLTAGASCVRSLQPLFGDEDLVFEPRLIGAWTDSDGQDNWTFEKSGEKEYLLTCRASEDQETALFRGRLGKLGGAYFLDLTPDKESGGRPHNDLLALHLVPAHTFWKVRFEGGLHLDPFSQDWLKEGIEAGRIKIGHVQTPDEVILTADTRELQALLAGAAKDEEAFPPSREPLRKR